MKKYFLFYVISYTFMNASCKKNMISQTDLLKSNFSKNSTQTLPQSLSTVLDTNNYIFVGQEDFNGTFLDTSIWSFYTENIVRGYGKMLRSNAEVSNGTLKLYARRTVSVNNETTFSAGMVGTEFSLNQRYGYFEIRAKVNNQVGPHAAFWLLQHSVGIVNAVPNPSIYGTEIDVFEYHRAAGNENLYHGLHWNGYEFDNGSHRSLFASTYNPGIATGFHTFALEWTPREYIVYVDGVEKIRTTTAISHTPQFLLLSTEINGYGGDRFAMSTTVPDVFEVDYVKVFAIKPAVTLFGACDYYGWVSASLQPGSYNQAQLMAAGIMNDETSAIEVPAGWKVTAFDEDNFAGTSTIITRDTRCLQNFNDKISSLIISRQ
jgi:beta-glucanase (GH16 family)